MNKYIKKINNLVISLVLLFCLQNDLYSTKPLVTLDEYIDVAVHKFIGSIPLAFSSLYMRFFKGEKLKSKVKRIIEQHRTIKEFIQEGLDAKHTEALENLRSVLKVPHNFWNQIVTATYKELEEDLKQLASPLKRDEAPQFHSNDIPADIMKVAYKVLRKYNINPDRIEIIEKIDDPEDRIPSVYVMLRSSGKRRFATYQLRLPMSFLKNFSLFEIEGMITHEIAHLMCGHILFTVKIKEYMKEMGVSTKNKTYQRYRHIQEYMADQYLAVENPRLITASKALLIKICHLDAGLMFVAGKTHPSHHSRVKKLQKLSLFFEYEADLKELS